MSHAARLAAAALAFAALWGCDPPEVPEELSYRLEVRAATEEGVDFQTSLRRLRRLEGATVLIGQRAVRRVGVSGLGVVANFREPSSVRPTQVARELGLRLETPCGPRTIRLPAPELDDDADSDGSVAAAMARGSIELRTELLAPELTRTRLYVDRGDDAGAEVAVGELTIPLGEDRADLAWLECEQAAVVRVGDASLGSVSAREPATFVSADPARCHRAASVRYGETVRREDEQRTGGVAMLSLSEDVDFFLEDAPESIEADQRDRVRTELVAVPCDEAPSEEEATEAP